MWSRTTENSRIDKTRVIQIVWAFGVGWKAALWRGGTNKKKNTCSPFATSEIKKIVITHGRDGEQRKGT